MIGSASAFQHVLVVLLTLHSMVFFPTRSTGRRIENNVNTSDEVVLPPRCVSSVEIRLVVFDVKVALNDPQANNFHI